MLTKESNWITIDLGVFWTANGKSTPYCSEAKAAMYTPQGSLLAMVDKFASGAGQKLNIPISCEGNNNMSKLIIIS